MGKQLPRGKANENVEGEALDSRVFYPGADAAAAGGDLEVSIEIPDGTSGEEALDHQQDAVNEEGGSHAVDHILEDVDPGNKDRDRDLTSRVTHSVELGLPKSLLLDCLKINRHGD